MSEQDRQYRETRQPGVLAPLPRRPFLTTKPTDATPPQMKTVSFATSRLTAFVRLIFWVEILARFAIAVLADVLQHSNRPARRAAHLRRIFEKKGGAYVKMGRLLATRLDLLRWEYGIELGAMVDRMRPFPDHEAIGIVERSTGGPLAQSFERFDPQPIVSTSMSCIYQAILRNGDRVVVKVRRPGAGELFMADIKAFEWLGQAFGLFVLLRPGYTDRITRELRQGLVEELDFIREARYMDLFRRAARKSGKRFFSAPRIYFELCGEDVMVQEMISGMWLTEVLAAVETNNLQALALAQKLKIQPQQIARRLTWINYWSWHEHFFFRADPDPDRIIVAADGKLFFIDFGSVGAIDRTRRRALDQNMHYAWKKDPLNMARASLVLLEPLPPLDTNELTKELEACNREMLFAFESRSNHDRFSRTGARQWVGLIDIARRARIMIDFHVLRLLRSSVIYDTLAVRLDREINIIKEYRRFTGYLAIRAQRRTMERLTATSLDLSDRNPIYLELERLANTGEGLFFRLRHVLAIPQVNFHSLSGKGSFVVYTAMRFVLQVTLLAGGLSAAVAGLHFAVNSQSLAASQALQQALSMPGFQVLVVLLLIINTRKILFRMDDKDS